MGRALAVCPCGVSEGQAVIQCDVNKVKMVRRAASTPECDRDNQQVHLQRIEVHCWGPKAGCVQQGADTGFENDSHDAT